MTDFPTQPPGWYHAQGDPEGTQRYWDGSAWQGEPVATGGGAPAPGGRPVSAAYAGWGQRVAASLIDLLLVLAVSIIIYVLALILGSISQTLGTIVLVLLGIPAFLGLIYLMMWLPGTTGQSPGRRVMGYQIVSDRDGTYIGGWSFIGREIIGGIINNLCYIDYLWPLWDKKNQRLADKVASSIAVKTEKGGLFPLFPDGKPF